MENLHAQMEHNQTALNRARAFHYMKKMFLFTQPNLSKGAPKNTNRVVSWNLIIGVNGYDQNATMIRSQTSSMGVTIQLQIVSHTWQWNISMKIQGCPSKNT